MKEYFNKWLIIAAKSEHNGPEEQKSYLHRISKEQEDSFLVFLKDLDKNKGFYPLTEVEILTNYISTFNSEDTLDYLELIGDLFPNIRFEFLSINYDNKEYGYKNY